jgi:outer membrane cobalamin receptor
VPDFFPAQRADHLVASLEHAFTPALEFRLEAYRKDYDALRPRFENLFDPFSLLPELQPDRVRVAPDEAVARGLEVLLRRRGDGPLDWWVSWAWAEARDDIDGRDVPRSWEQRHTLNGGLVYARGPWSATLAGTWHSGWPTTAVTLAADGSVAVGPRNASAFDDFLSVDLRAGYTTTLGPAEVETYVEFTNAIAHRNPCCAAYSVETGAAGPELVRDLDYWPRFVPNLGVRVRF